MRIAGEFLLLCFLGAAQHVEAAKILSFAIERAASPLKHVLRRRDSSSKSFTEVINHIGAGNGYTANVSVGTPPQPLILGIDTGSTDAWVLSNTANICLNKTLIAEGVTCAHGTFNPNKSSTIATAVAGGFSATYLDKTGSTGDYITDILMIGGHTLKGMQMGLAFNSTDSQGTLGLGYDTLEGATTKYPSFIDQLVLQGITNTKAFSLYLNDLASSTGNLLFGGIDTEKFTGTLQTLPLIPSTPNGTIIYYGVALTAVSVVSSNTTHTYNLTSNASDGSTVSEIGVVMDSGSVFTYLPTAAVQSIYKLLGAVQSPLASYLVFVDCSLLEPASGPVTTIDFQFTGPTGPIISVPLNEMVFPLSDYAEIANHISALGTLPFKDTCMFGLLGADEAGGASVLGDTFLRSAYLVYDLDSNSIAIAQTVFNSTSSNVVEFAAGQSGFPVGSGVSSTAASSATGSSTGSAGTTPKPTGTGSGAATSSTSKAAAGFSSPPRFNGGGLVVLILVGLCSLVGAGWFLA